MTSVILVFVRFCVYISISFRAPRHLVTKAKALCQENRHSPNMTSAPLQILDHPAPPRRRSPTAPSAVDKGRFGSLAFLAQAAPHLEGDGRGHPVDDRHSMGRPFGEDRLGKGLVVGHPPRAAWKKETAGVCRDRRATQTLVVWNACRFMEPPKPPLAVSRQSYGQPQTGHVWV